jgi:hypothetical protein
MKRCHARHLLIDVDTLSKKLLDLFEIALFGSIVEGCCARYAGATKEEAQNQARQPG